MADERISAAGMDTASCHFEESHVSGVVFEPLKPEEYPAEQRALIDEVNRRAEAANEKYRLALQRETTAEREKNDCLKIIEGAGKERQEDAIQELLKLIIHKSGQPLITTLIETVAAYYHADRCYIFEQEPTGRYIVNTDEWCAPGVKPEKDNLQQVPVEIMDPWVNEFHKQGCFYPSCDDGYAEKEPFIYEVLQPQNIQSLMAAPMMESGREIGFLGVDDPRENTGHKLYLTIAATAAYHELRSIREKDKLDHAMRRNRLIEEFVHAGQWSYLIDANGEVTSVNYDNAVAGKTSIVGHTDPMGWL